MESERTRTSPQPSLATRDVFRLVVLYSPRAASSETSAVVEGRLLLSRERGGTEERGAHLVLQDAEVSRRHALLEVADQGASVRLIDQSSHNGTFVNGQRVDARLLAPGDVIRVGQHLLLVQCLDAQQVRLLARRRRAASRLLGHSTAIKAVDAQLQACAGNDVPVLLLGESGTGKELAAKELHALSGRQGALVTVNCTTLQQGTADSELFGHQRGAFSDARESRQGLFAAADGGTLFLDELGDLPLGLQPKLLRTLEDGEIRPVGSDRSRRINARVVAATNVDLDVAVVAGRFRGDLLARLKRLVVELPPLRERREDVLPLVRHFLDQAEGRYAVGPDAAEALLAYRWPYNIRELRNAVEFAVRQMRGKRAMTLADLPPAVGESMAHRASATVARRIEPAPRDAADLQRVLRQCDWNISRAAEAFGKDRKQVYRWCKRFDVDLEGRG